MKCDLRPQGPRDRGRGVVPGSWVTGGSAPLRRGTGPGPKTHLTWPAEKGCRKSSAVHACAPDFCWAGSRGPREAPPRPSPFRRLSPPRDPHTLSSSFNWSFHYPHKAHPLPSSHPAFWPRASPPPARGSPSSCALSVLPPNPLDLPGIKTPLGGSWTD